MARATMHASGKLQRPLAVVISCGTSFYHLKQVYFFTLPIVRVES